MSTSSSIVLRWGLAAFGTLAAVLLTTVALGAGVMHLAGGPQQSGEQPRPTAATAARGSVRHYKAPRQVGATAVPQVRVVPPQQVALADEPRQGAAQQAADTPAAGPASLGPAAFGLCATYFQGSLLPTARAYWALAQAAGGPAFVTPFCQLQEAGEPAMTDSAKNPFGQETLGASVSATSPSPVASGTTSAERTTTPAATTPRQPGRPSQSRTLSPRDAAQQWQSDRARRS